MVKVVMDFIDFSDSQARLRVLGDLRRKSKLRYVNEMTKKLKHCVNNNRYDFC